MRERGETETRADAPELKLEADFWQGARIIMPPPGKSSIHLRVDTDVLDRMNAVLRSFMEAQKQHRPRCTTRS